MNFWSRKGPSSSIATLLSSSSAGDTPKHRTGEQVKMRKAEEATSDQLSSKRTKVDAQEGSSDSGDSAKSSSESGSQESGESTTIPSDDGYKDVPRTTKQIKNGDRNATLARFKCPMHGCTLVFRKDATDKTTVVQHVLKQHSKELHHQKKHVCNFGCKAGHLDLYYLWKHNSSRTCKGKNAWDQDKKVRFTCVWKGCNKGSSLSGYSKHWTKAYARRSFKSGKFAAFTCKLCRQSFPHRSLFFSHMCSTVRRDTQGAPKHVYTMYMTGNWMTPILIVFVDAGYDVSVGDDEQDQDVDEDESSDEEAEERDDHIALLHLKIREKYTRSKCTIALSLQAWPQRWPPSESSLWKRRFLRNYYAF